MKRKRIDRSYTKARFAEEREKRLRPDAATQYINVSGEMEKDPWQEVKERAPVKDHVTFTFVGGGFAGLITGAELAKNGIQDVRIIDRAGDFGGVWYWNRYPGLMCDSPALIYLPLLEETGHMPTEKYVHQPEILAHCQRIGSHFGLYEKSLFHTGIRTVKWNEKESCWHISTDRGDEFTSTFLGMGTGFLSTPKLPRIKGIDKFQGKAFHAARWDYDYTGGGPDTPLEKLKNKRVAVIGTGASAIQLVAPTAESAKELLVFQRTPSALHPRNNGPMDEAYFTAIASEAGWQEKYHENMVLAYSGIAGQPYQLTPPERLIKGDAFVDIFDAVYKVIHDIPLPSRNIDTVMQAMDQLDLDSVAHTHAHTEAIVEDAQTADKLKPWYRPACKRPTFNDDYLPAFNRANTQLIDTDGKGVTEITAKGVVANGEHYDVDCIIYASGFEFAKNILNGVRFQILGRNGLSLHDYWRDGVQSLHGMHVNGFPNLFMVQLAQGADFAPNIPTGWQDQARTIASIVAHMQAHSFSVTEAEAAHERAWVSLISGAEPVPDLRDCTPGLLSNEGQVNAAFSTLQGYPDGSRAFFKLMANWRLSGEFEGLSFT